MEQRKVIEGKRRKSMKKTFKNGKKKMREVDIDANEEKRKKYSYRN